MAELYGEYISGKSMTFGSKESHQNVFASEDYLLQFNGRFNNAEDLKKELRLDNLKDEEVIIELFRRHGAEKAIQLLDGAFAFALFDKKNGKLFLTRDRMAQVPLYYNLSNNKIIFSSSINTLLENSGIKREFDIEGILINLSSNKWTNPERTHIKGVFMVEHGTFMECNEYGLHNKKYCSFYTDLKYSEDELVHKFGMHFEETIAKEVKAYKNFAVSLSGGLDSSLVVQRTLDQLLKLGLITKDRFKAYTIKYIGEKEHKDLEYARLLAHERNIPLEEIILGEEDFTLQKIDELLLITQQIPFDPTSMGDLLIRRKVKQDGNNVLLTGNGSDEIWVGYLGICQSGVFDGVVMKVDAIVNSYLSSAFFKKNWNSSMHNIANTVLRQTTQKYLIDNLKSDRYNALAIYAIKTVLNHNNTQEYNFTKSLGIDIVMPFINSNNLTALPFTTSGPSKIKDGKAKYFIRKYAEEKLPNKIINRPKFPYPDPKDPVGSVNYKIRQLCKENWKSIINSPIINTIIKRTYLKNSKVENFNYRELWLLLILWSVEELYRLDIGLSIKDRHPLPYTPAVQHACDTLSMVKAIEQHVEKIVIKKKNVKTEDISL